jgi:protein TonB
MSDPDALEPTRAVVRPWPLGLQSLALVAGGRESARRGAPLTASFLLHAALVGSTVLVPLLTYDTVPDQDVSGFLPEPLAIVAPPPPPPPPASGVGVARRAAPPAPATGFMAPADVSPELVPDALDLGPAGEVGGVEGGVPDGLVGAIVGGLPPAAPPAPASVVRISAYAAPRLVRKVTPIYPDLAQKARLSGIVVVEAEVDVQGRVTKARVVRGHPLLAPAAVEAVEQWRYQPLLLGGEPTAFVVTVSITFSLSR